MTEIISYFYRGKLFICLANRVVNQVKALSLILKISSIGIHDVSTTDDSELGQEINFFETHYLYIYEHRYSNLH